jgi:hypothetical protein
MGDAADDLTDRMELEIMDYHLHLAGRCVNYCPWCLAILNGEEGDEDLHTKEEETMDKQEFEMTEEQHRKLLEAMRPVPLIMLQCGMPPSPQESANRAWERLGKDMGFQYMTITPLTDKGDRCFLATPTLGRTPGVTTQQKENET